MAQQLINVGAAANDRTGDTWRDAMIKANANFTEVYGFQTNNVIVINQESDFPVQDATTITLSAGVGYQLGDVLTTSKNFICNGGVIFSNTGLAANLVFTGTGSVFTLGTGVLFEIRNLGIVAPAANIFDYNGAGSLNMSGVAIFQCLDIGDFVAGTFSSVIFDNFATLNVAGNGFSFTGAFELLSAARGSISTTSATHTVFDLGTSTFNSINIERVDGFGPLGSVGISGAAASANLTSGRVGRITDCALNGTLMTPLSTIASSDIRWCMSNNADIPDSIEDALLSFNGNVTETTIGVGDGDNGNPKLITATWTCIRESKATCSTAGRVTSDSEQILAGVPLDATVGLISSGGGAIDVTVYLAKNGTAISESATTVAISGSNQQLVHIPWQDQVDLNDYYEIFIENNTNTTNIICESGKLRFR
jgi:hypothetical protein